MVKFELLGNEMSVIVRQNQRVILSHFVNLGGA